MKYCVLTGPCLNKLKAKADRSRELIKSMPAGRLIKIQFHFWNGHSIIQPAVNCKELVIFSNKMHKEFQLTNRSVLMSAYKIVIRKCSNIIAQWDKNQCHVFWCKVYVFLQKTLFSYVSSTPFSNVHRKIHFCLLLKVS